MKKWKKFFYEHKKEIIAILLAVTIYPVFELYSPPMSAEEIKDATVNESTGDFAMVFHSGEQLFVSVYNHNAELVFQQGIEDYSGGRASCFLWYEDENIKLGMSSSYDDIITISPDGTVLSKDRIENDISNEFGIEQWSPEWEIKWYGKYMACDRSMYLQGVKYKYNHNNFFLRRFFNQRNTMTITTADGIEIEIWRSPGHLFWKDK